MGDIDQVILSALLAASDANAETRGRGELEIQKLKANPDVFFSGCARLLTNAAVPIHGRQLVGFVLKNNLGHPACVQNTALQQSVMNHAVADPDRRIRAVACTIISCAVREAQWPVEVVVKLLTEVLVARKEDLCAVHGAMRALSQIVDDCVQLLDARQLTGVVVEAVLPFVHSSSLPGKEGQEVQLGALDALAVMLELPGVDFESFSYKGLRPYIPAVIEGCFANLQNPVSSQLCARCVKCLVLSLGFHDLVSDDLFHQMSRLMTAAMTSGDGPDEELRIEAVEFWRGSLCFPRFAALVEPMIDGIIPILVRSMVYSDMEIGMLQANADDWNVPDKIEDIKPRHYQARVNAAGADDDDDDGDEEEVVEWNLRRVSALTLDSIAEYFGERIIPTVLNCIEGMMQPGKPWKELEAAILALGAIMDGCFSFMTPYLDGVSARLLQLLNDQSAHFLVWSISLWTMTQIGQYVVSLPDKLRDFLACVLRKMQSPSKLVQEGATAALQGIVLICNEGQLNNDTPAVISCIVQCLRGYQLKNRVLLFETLESVCNVLEEPLRSSPDVLEALMVPLGEIWANTPDESPLIFSLFRCMSSVCRVMGPSMQPTLAKEIFHRAYRILVSHVQARAQAKQLNEDPPEYEFPVTASDLLSGLFDALGSGLELLLQECNPPFITTVLHTLHDEDTEVRRCGFSLLGDMSKNMPTSVQRFLPDVVKAALENLASFNENTSGVVSNVAWSFCNLLENQMDINSLPLLDASNGLPQLFGAMARILNTSSHSADMRNMVENVCICLGLMMYTNSNIEALSGSSVGMFAETFCIYMRNVKDAPHKELAVSGFILSVRQQLQLVLNFLHLFFDLALSVASSNPEVRQAMVELLIAAKNYNPTLWNQLLEQYSRQARTRLYHVYGLN
uniref:Uncharacterized protein n=1 Tax=Trypanosoma vivax (strain Y486) TaxID=1055687 RepID=G0U3J7_TRYVY|nr:conserved hypothetical protein [Trypanosoma vivax Y486]